MGLLTSEKDDINEQYGNSSRFINQHSPLLSSGSSDSSISYKERTSYGTRFSFSVVNLMNAILGTGILGLSYALAEAGIILFIILLTLVVAVTIYSVNLLLELCNITGVMAYEDLGFVALKKPGKVLTAAMIMTQNIGSMSSYLLIIKNELPEIIMHLTDIKEPDGSWYQNGDYLLLIVVILVILPLCCLPKIGFLSFTSTFSVIGMLFFMMVVVVEKFLLPCPTPASPQTTSSPVTTGAMWHNVDEGKINDTCQLQYFNFNINSAYAIPTMTFSFVCHTAIIPVYNELSNSTKPKMLKVSVSAILCCFVMYLVTAVFGYLTFYENVYSELLLSYNQYPHPITIISVVRLVVVVAIIFHLPVVHYPCRLSLMMMLTMILPKTAPSRTFIWAVFVTSTLILLTTVTLIALFVPDIKIIFGIVGATSSTGLMFFLPSLFYLLIAPGKLFSRHKIISIILFLSSFAILFICLSAIIYGLVHGVP